MTSSIIEKDPSCRDDFDPKSLAPDVALEKIRDSVSPIEQTEVLPIRETLNRILAEDILSSINVPSGTNSAMDGYAVNSNDLPVQGTTELHLVGTSWAGKPLAEAIQSGTCARIMTGAILPDGANTVVIQEDVKRDGDIITIDNNTRAGDNIRQAGEDIAQGDLVLSKGTPLCPAEIGLIASIGIDKVKVTRKLRVAFFSTGDELRSVGEPLEQGCVYDSNRYILHSMLTRLNVDIIDMGVIRDEPDAIEAAFLSAADQADMVITSGGVSVGDADFVRDILAKIGVVAFWKVAMKPGRPLAFGKIKNAIFFGLPGNPVSVMVTFYQFVQPALKTMTGNQQSIPNMFKVKCVSRLKKRPGRVEYQRGILERDETGELTVRKTGAQGSGILNSMSRANCFIVLPMENSGVSENEIIDVQPFFGIV